MSADTLSQACYAAGRYTRRIAHMAIYQVSLLRRLVHRLPHRILYVPRLLPDVLRRGSDSAGGGHHAHESPPRMTVPLVVLAVCAAVVGAVFIHGSFAGNYFVEFLGHTPSLAAGAVADTREPGKFHLDVAGISTVVALAGICLAVFLYLGERTEAGSSAMRSICKARALYRCAVGRSAEAVPLDRPARSLAAVGGSRLCREHRGLLLGVIALDRGVAAHDRHAAEPLSAVVRQVLSSTSFTTGHRVAAGTAGRGCAAWIDR